MCGRGSWERVEGEERREMDKNVKLNKNNKKEIIIKKKKKDLSC